LSPPPKAISGEGRGRSEGSQSEEGMGEVNGFIWGKKGRVPVEKGATGGTQGRGASMGEGPLAGMIFRKKIDRVGSKNRSRRKGREGGGLHRGKQNWHREPCQGEICLVGLVNNRSKGERGEALSRKDSPGKEKTLAKGREGITRYPLMAPGPKKAMWVVWGGGGWGGGAVMLGVGGGGGRGGEWGALRGGGLGGGVAWGAVVFLCKGVVLKGPLMGGARGEKIHKGFDFSAGSLRGSTFLVSGVGISLRGHKSRVRVS